MPSPFFSFSFPFFNQRRLESCSALARQQHYFAFSPSQGKKIEFHCTLRMVSRKRKKRGILRGFVVVITHTSNLNAACLYKNSLCKCECSAMKQEELLPSIKWQQHHWAGRRMKSGNLNENSNWQNMFANVYNKLRYARRYKRLKIHTHTVWWRTVCHQTEHLLSRQTAFGLKLASSPPTYVFLLFFIFKFNFDSFPY